MPETHLQQKIQPQDKAQWYQVSLCEKSKGPGDHAVWVLSNGSNAGRHVNKTVNVRKAKVHTGEVWITGLAASQISLRRDVRVLTTFATTQKAMDWRR